MSLWLQVYSIGYGFGAGGDKAKAWRVASGTENLDFAEGVSGKLNASTVDASIGKKRVLAACGRSFPPCHVSRPQRFSDCCITLTFHRHADRGAPDAGPDMRRRRAYVP